MLPCYESADPIGASESPPTEVRIEKRRVLSGRGGMPSIGYVAVLVDPRTGQELARTRDLGYNAGPVASVGRGRVLADRKGYRVVGWLVPGWQGTGRPTLPNESPERAARGAR